MYLSKLVLNPRSPRARFELQNPYELHRTLLKAVTCLSGEEQVAEQSRAPEAAKCLRLPKRAQLLFRIESQIGVLLVQTAEVPNWDALTVPRDYLLSIERPLKLEIDRMLERTVDREGRRILRFRLRARPSHKPKDQSAFETPKKPGHRRVALRSDDQIEQWLVAQGQRWGFDIPCTPGADGSRLVLQCDLSHIRWKDNKRLPCIADDAAVVDYYAWLRADMASPGPHPGIAANNLGRERRPLEKQGWLTAIQFDGVLVVTDRDKLREAVANGIGPQKAYGFGLLSLAPLRE